MKVARMLPIFSARWLELQQNFSLLRIQDKDRIEASV